MIPGYASQQLRSANSILLCKLQPLRDRLECVYNELEPLIPADFPPHFRNDYCEIMSCFTRLRSTSSASDGEELDLANRLRALYLAMEAEPSSKARASFSDEDPMDLDIRPTNRVSG